MVTTKRITVDDLERDGVPDGFWELIDGRIVEVPPAGGEASSIGVTLTSYLAPHVRERGLGRVYGADGGFVLYPRTEREMLRAPDAAFVRAERVPPLELHARFLRLAPDLVAEVVSPSNSAPEVAEKIAMWPEAGVRLAWVVDPSARTVAVHAPNQPIRLLREQDDLDGGDVLPDFRVRVSDLFA